jgi:hypothetical protein
MELGFRIVSFTYSLNVCDDSISAKYHSFGRTHECMVVSVVALQLLVTKVAFSM